MWKSSATYRHYRPGSSQRRGDAATFRRQMADFARAELLRDLRHAAHLSRESLAHEVGVSTKTIYSWENGGGIQWHNALKIAAFFHVDPESLVARDPPPAAATPTAGETQLDRIEGKLDQALSAQAEIHAALDELLTATGRQRVKAATGRAAARSRQRRATGQEDPPGRQAGGRAS